MSNENSFEQIENQRPVIYALIWKASTIGTQSMKDFEDRIPRLMAWLKQLRQEDHLVACGGGAFESSEGFSGGLTLVKAKSFEHAKQLSLGTPMNEIGKTEVMIWDVFTADLQLNPQWLLAK
jgi:uncharacterized protein YciI